MIVVRFCYIDVLKNKKIYTSQLDLVLNISSLVLSIFFVAVNNLVSILIKSSTINQKIGDSIMQIRKRDILINTIRLIPNPDLPQGNHRPSPIMRYLVLYRFKYAPIKFRSIGAMPLPENQIEGMESV